MTPLRVLVLGNPAAGDDGAALAAVEGPSAAEMRRAGAEVILAGRPGPGLLDLLAPECEVLLVDVVRSGAEPGTIHCGELADLVELAMAGRPTSSHGLGPVEVLRLAKALGRELPPGRFIGLEGSSFGPGIGLSPKVAAQLGEFRRTIAAMVQTRGARLCTKAD